MGQALEASPAGNWSVAVDSTQQVSGGSQLSDQANRGISDFDRTQMLKAGREPICQLRIVGTVGVCVG
jgi:hypothetical protein